MQYAHNHPTVSDSKTPPWAVQQLAGLIGDHGRQYMPPGELKNSALSIAKFGARSVVGIHDSLNNYLHCRELLLNIKLEDEQRRGLKLTGSPHADLIVLRDFQLLAERENLHIQSVESLTLDNGDPSFFAICFLDENAETAADLDQWLIDTTHSLFAHKLGLLTWGIAGMRNWKRFGFVRVIYGARATTAHFNIMIPRTLDAIARTTGERVRFAVIEEMFGRSGGVLLVRGDLENAQGQGMIEAVRKEALIAWNSAEKESPGSAPNLSELLAAVDRGVMGSDEIHFNRGLDEKWTEKWRHHPKAGEYFKRKMEEFDRRDVEGQYGYLSYWTTVAFLKSIHSIRTKQALECYHEFCWFHPSRGIRRWWKYLLSTEWFLRALVPYLNYHSYERLKTIRGDSNPCESDWHDLYSKLGKLLSLVDAMDGLRRVDILAVDAVRTATRSGVAYFPDTHGPATSISRRMRRTGLQQVEFAATRREKAAPSSAAATSSSSSSAAAEIALFKEDVDVLMDLKRIYPSTIDRSSWQRLHRRWGAFNDQLAAWKSYARNPDAPPPPTSRPTPPSLLPSLPIGPKAGKALVERKSHATVTAEQDAADVDLASSDALRAEEETFTRTWRSNGQEPKRVPLPALQSPPRKRTNRVIRESPLRLSSTVPAQLPFDGTGHAQRYSFDMVENYPLPHSYDVPIPSTSSLPFPVEVPLAPPAAFIPYDDQDPSQYTHDPYYAYNTYNNTYI
ncbi:hypothetical protein RQP46_008095 [Phenoliferia psychrophenolica]